MPSLSDVLDHVVSRRHGLIRVDRKRKRLPKTDYGRKQDDRRAESIAAVRAAEQEWESKHRGMARPLPSEFAPIREALRGCPLQRIVNAIDVSRTAASKIRSGKLVPHVRHWEALAKLASASESGEPEGEASTRNV
jgi:hypothetical protein